MVDRKESSRTDPGPPSSAPVRAELLAAEALDPQKEDDVAKAVSQLTPEEAAHFVALLERAIKRRRIQLIGYLVALVVLMVGMFLALAYFGASEEGSFVGWVFLLPFVAVGAIFFVFGRWANRVR
jgi:uncharacterized membrane protein